LQKKPVLRIVQKLCWILDGLFWVGALLDGLFWVGTLSGSVGLPANHKILVYVDNDLGKDFNEITSMTVMHMVACNICDMQMCRSIYFILVIEGDHAVILNWGEIMLEHN
jgi:hypothetical protein